MPKLVFIVNSQEEFWRREFKGEVFKKDENFLSLIHEQLARGVVPIIQLDENQSELELLKELPEKSVIGWCHSDEKYDLGFARILTEIPAIKLLLRPYRLTPYKISHSIKALSNTFKSFTNIEHPIEVFKLIAWVFRGLGMQIRQHRIIKLFNTNKLDFLNIPIGYTNVFAKAVVACMEEIGEVENDSLLHQFEIFDKISTDFQVSFVGQSGQIVRRLAIRNLQGDANFSLVERDGYGASNQINGSVFENAVQYIKSSLNSRFVFCPPGNISGESFRIFETIVLRRVPLVQNHVTSDPNYSCLFTAGMDVDLTISWNKQLVKATDLSEREYADRRDFIWSNLKLSIDELQVFLERQMGFDLIC